MTLTFIYVCMNMYMDLFFIVRTRLLGFGLRRTQRMAISRPPVQLYYEVKCNAWLLIFGLGGTQRTQPSEHD